MWWFANVLYEDDGWSPYPPGTDFLIALTGGDDDYVWRTFQISIDYLDLGFPRLLRELEIRTKFSGGTSASLYVQFCDNTGTVLHTHSFDITTFTDWTTINYVPPVSWQRLRIDATGLFHNAFVYISRLRGREEEPFGYRTLIGVGR
ncbi:MAG: hypothetical protein KatS3mg087_1749 [Patescibacteria group bacterium]|nr:MAG: hypothetical protein KatS3mg087_1749 [Patescibacteria group bacterium]